MEIRRKEERQKERERAHEVVPTVWSLTIILELDAGFGFIRVLIKSRGLGFRV